MQFSSALTTLFLATAASAATVSYTWEATWVWAAPDGVGRPVIGINGAWPNPSIEANVGDTIVVTLTNSLHNETTGLHFHGISQVGTPYMDGPSGVTQCPIPPGSTFTYQFTADVAGTYWYHSHNMGQYPDGLRGPLIVKDPNDPYLSQYQQEYVLTVSDWYHTQSVYLVQNMLQTSNTNFLPPFPDNILINEGLGANITWSKGTTYRIRIISFAAFASVFLHFDSHTMHIIMNDATLVQNSQAYQLRISPAQRYDILLTPANSDHRNYPFLLSLDQNRDWKLDPPQQVSWPYNYTGQLIMDPNGALTTDVVNSWSPVDEISILPYDNQAQLPAPDQIITLTFNFCFDVNGYPRACFNNATYIPQKVPTLYTAATTGSSNTQPSIYGDVQPFIVESGQVVDIVINNLDAAIHPFHLHGHQFQILDRPGANEGPWGGHSRQFRATPNRRDTVQVFPNSYAVLRFKADNAGVFLFHCHIEWHVEMGLTATIIESPDQLATITIPQDHLAACQAQNIPTSGNAGGATNLSDTSGFVTVPPTTYTGALFGGTSSSRRYRPRAVRTFL